MHPQLRFFRAEGLSLVPCPPGSGTKHIYGVGRRSLWPWLLRLWRSLATPPENPSCPDRGLSKCRDRILRWSQLGNGSCRGRLPRRSGSPRISKSSARHAGPFQAEGVGNDDAEGPGGLDVPSQKSRRCVRPWHAPVRRPVPAAWPSNLYIATSLSDPSSLFSAAQLLRPS